VAPPPGVAGSVAGVQRGREGSGEGTPALEKPAESRNDPGGEPAKPSSTLAAGVPGQGGASEEGGELAVVNDPLVKQAMELFGARITHVNVRKRE